MKQKFWLSLLTLAGMVAILMAIRNGHPTAHGVIPQSARLAGTQESSDSVAVDIASAIESHDLSESRRGKLASLYSARTIDELQRLAPVVNGEQVADLVELSTLSEVFCNVGYSLVDGGNEPSMKVFVKMLTRSKSGGATSQDLASAEWLDGLRARFCSQGVALQDTNANDAFSSLDASMIEAAGLVEVHDALALRDELESVADRIESGESISEQSAADLLQRVSETRERLIDFLKRTQSPAAFRRAAEVLSEDLFAKGWYPGVTSNYADNFMAPEIGWRSVGADLAFCRLAGPGCGPTSMALVHRCMPNNCRPGETVADFWRRTTSPQAMEAAQAYADALLAIRQGKP
jgi:hypothetical protein